MKKVITFAILMCALAASAAQVVTLSPGTTNSVPAGRVLAVEAVTVTASQQVKLGCVATVQDWTNATSVAWNYATNYVVCSSNLSTSVTNVTTVTRPWRDIVWVNSQVIWVSTNDVSTAVTNTWRARGESYSVSTNLWTGTASGHYLKAMPSDLYLLGGGIYVTAGEDDAVRILIGE